MQCRNYDVAFLSAWPLVLTLHLSVQCPSTVIRHMWDWSCSQLCCHCIQQFSCLGSILIMITFFVIMELRSGAQKIVIFLTTWHLDYWLYLCCKLHCGLHQLSNTLQQNHQQRVPSVSGPVRSPSHLHQLVHACFFPLDHHFSFLLLSHYCLLLSLYCYEANAPVQGAPLFTVVPFMVTGHLGYASYAASNWCFVKDTLYGRKNTVGERTLGRLLPRSPFARRSAYC